MPDVTQITKMSDAAVASVISGLWTIFPDHIVTLAYKGGATASLSKEGELKGLSHKQRTIEYFKFDLEKFNQCIIFCRGIFDGSLIQAGSRRDRYHDFIHFRKSSAIYDEVAIYAIQPDQGRPAIPIDLIRKVDTVLSRYYSIEGDGADRGLSEAGSLALNQIEDLRRLSLTMVEQQNLQQQQLENDFSKRDIELRGELAKDRAALDDEKKRLEVYRTEIDDREPVHARRALRLSVTNDIKEALSRPSKPFWASASKVYYIYLLIGFSLAAVSVLIFVDNGQHRYPQSELGWFQFWEVLLKGVTTGAAGLAFMWGGLNSWRRSEEAKQSYEQTLQRYAFDMDRSSWIVETLIQMNRIEKSSIPKEWLAGVCTDLFSSHHSVHASNTDSVDHVAALLKASARAKFNSQGLEFELDRKGINALQ